MNYNLYKSLRRNRSAITLFGYTRNFEAIKRATTVKHTRTSRDAKIFKLFLSVQNEISKFHQQTPLDTTLPDNSSKLKESTSFLDKNHVDSFAIELNSDGHCLVGVRKGQKIIKITNHVGNFEALSSILKSNKNGLDKPDDDYEAANQTITLLENYLHLIKFCFKYLGKSANEFTQEESEYFKICSKSPIIISIEDSEERYIVEDILITYFKFIANSVSKIVGRNPKKLILVVPTEFGVFEKTELKKCVKHANLDLLKIISKPLAKIITLNKLYKKPTNCLNRNFLIDLNSGPISLTYYEVMNDGKIVIISLMHETTLTVKMLRESAISLLIRKIPYDMGDQLFEDLGQLQKYIEEIDEQFSNDEQSAILVLDHNQKIEIKKYEVENILRPFVNHIIKFINAVLLEQKFSLSEQVVRIDYCSSIFSYLTGSMITDTISSLHDDQLIYGEKEVHSISGVVAFADRVCNNRTKDYIDTTLSCSIGVGEYRGVFVKQLQRGSTLPCSNSIILNTVVDYQKSCLIEIYQGERPFSRFCNLIGRLSINDLPPEKAYKIEIEVILNIDKDETLSVQAYELRTSKPLNVAIEKGHIHINNVNMVLDAIDNREADEKLIEKLDRASYLIESARTKYENTKYETMIFDKMNEFVSWLTDRKRTIDIDQADYCIKSIEKFLKSHDFTV